MITVTLWAIALTVGAEPPEVPATGAPASPVDLALVPSLSVNALQPEHVADNVLALAVLAHRSRNLDGLALAGGGSWVEGRMRGLQVSLFNRALSTEGGQLGAFNMSSEGVTGLQLAGIMNFSLGSTRGLQLAGVVNVGFEDFAGVQVGTANIVGEQLTGLQLGALNRARDVRGAQVGAFNVAGRVDGLMLGLVNIADHADVPIGLINWLADGENRVIVEGGETQLLSGGVKLGHSWLFSHLAFGVSRALGQPRFALGAGLGVRARRGPWLGELEVMGHYTSMRTVVGGPAAIQAAVRLNVGVQLMPRLALLVGPALNLFVPLDPGARLDGFMPAVALGGGERPLQLYPGFQAALQF